MSKVDTRTRTDHATRGVVAFGSRRLHAVRSENVHGATMWCGIDGVSCKSDRRVSCGECLDAMERFGYVR